MKFAANRLFALIFSALFFAVFAAGAELKIATFNAQNLFDAKNDGSEYKDFVVGKSEWNEKKASAKFKAVSAKIKELNAGLSDSKIYQQIGLTALYNDLEAAKSELETLENEYFEVLEIAENLEQI